VLFGIYCETLIIYIGLANRKRWRHFIVLYLTLLGLWNNIRAVSSVVVALLVVLIVLR
jgi:hypothetical protein